MCKSYCWSGSRCSIGQPLLLTQTSWVLPPLSVGKMTLRLYGALNYSHGLSKGPSFGTGRGRFGLLPWERRFLRRAFRPGIQTAALTVARGNGKTTLSASVAAAAVDGPLAQRRADTVVVASSFGQARILFEHTKAFLDPVFLRDGMGPRGRFRVNRASPLDL